MVPLVRIRSGIFRDARALVRYDDGKATRVHALFPSPSFDAIVAFWTGRFGPPVKTLERRPVAGQPNPSVVWMGIDPTTDMAVALEVHKFDDVRSSYPDTEHGAIMLFPAFAVPIFPRMPLLDLRLRMMK